MYLLEVESTGLFCACMYIGLYQMLSWLNLQTLSSAFPMGDIFQSFLIGQILPFPHRLTFSPHVFLLLLPFSSSLPIQILHTISHASMTKGCARIQAKMYNIKQYTRYKYAKNQDSLIEMCMNLTHSDKEEGQGNPCSCLRLVKQPKRNRRGACSGWWVGYLPRRWWKGTDGTCGAVGTNWHKPPNWGLCPSLLSDIKMVRAQLNQNWMVLQINKYRGDL